MGYYRSGHAIVNSQWPRAFAVCDRCGFVYNHKDLNWQEDWRGPKLQNTKFLVCESCLDKPNEQLRTVTIAADPIPIDYPRPESYDISVPSYYATNGETDRFGTVTAQDTFINQDGDDYILEIEDTPTPNPENPVIYPDG